MLLQMQVGGHMKYLIPLSLFFLFGSFSYAQDLKINVEKVSELLNGSMKNGRTTNGKICTITLRNLQDDFHSLLITSEHEHIFIGIDYEVYNTTPYSIWRKNYFEMHEYGKNGEQHLIMKKEKNRLTINAIDEFRGDKKEINCNLPPLTK